MGKETLYLLASLHFQHWEYLDQGFSVSPKNELLSLPRII